jgi:hypothetical protein
MEMAKLRFESPKSYCVGLNNMEKRAIVLCWGIALILLVGPVLDATWDATRAFLFPNTLNDALIHPAFMRKAADGFHSGDPFLWEHRTDPTSVTSFFHFWPHILGHVLKIAEYPGLLVLSVFFSGLWFYSIYRFCRELGQSLYFALFSAGIQTFFVVNLAYQINGFKTNWQNYNFWITEHMRLYPSVISMAVYNLVAFLVLVDLRYRKLITLILAALIGALTVYGRPFDWMIFMGALALLIVAAFLKGDRALSLRVFLLFMTTLILSSPFIWNYVQYQKLYASEYFETIARANLQVKNLSHYIKYGILVILLLGSVALFYRREIFTRRQIPLEATGRATIWILLLFTSSLLIHFKSALEGGITLAGFAYSMIFSAAPWLFMLVANASWHHLFSNVRPSLSHFMGPFGIVTLGCLLLIQQLGAFFFVPARFPHAVVSEDRLKVYSWLKDQPQPRPVVLTLGRGLEMTTLANTWIFFTNPIVVTSTCSAKNTELLERYLYSKLLLTGTIADLQPLFSDQGLVRPAEWLTQQSPSTRFWASLLQEALGYNTYNFHPIKNAGELRVRKIQLPSTLQNHNDFVVYFTSDLRSLYQGLLQTQSKMQPEAWTSFIRSKYRLDYVCIPNTSEAFIRNIPATFPKWSKAGPTSSEVTLWKVE